VNAQRLMTRQALQTLAGAAVAAVLAAGALPAQAQAQPGTQPENIVSLSASANLEVTMDLLRVHLQATREGNDAQSVQAGLKQALDAALLEARRAKAGAADGALDFRTGSFSIYPRHTQNGRIGSWQGSAELVLEGRDTAAVAQLAGRIQTMVVVNTGYSLSRELREQHEATVTAEAIRRFRARAADYARQFGFGSYVLREVNVSAADQDFGRPVPMVMMRAKAMEAEAAPLPTEPGRGLITASVQGSVQLRP
jgi:predicted secreted protein